MEIGRPTKFKEEYCEVVEMYIKENQDSYEEDKLNVQLPTVGGFWLYLNEYIQQNHTKEDQVTERVLYDWKEQHPKFLQSFNKIVKEQEKRLLNKGLSGDYNPTIAKLILSANHNMKERSDVTSDEKPIQGNVITFKDYGETRAT